MQDERFDALSRLIGARTSRRMAVGLAATGLLSLAVPDVAAAVRCSNRKPCPECKKCRKHRCRPDATQDGNACIGGGACESGTCQATACLALQADCTDAKQCCQDEGATSCAPGARAPQRQCCRPLGGACSTPGAFDECCAVVHSPESVSLVNCAPTNTCGGAGGRCTFATTCASGVCCGFGIDTRCCAAGQRCENFSCVN